MEKNKNIAADERADIVYIDIDKIRPHEKNPRKDVGDVSELAESIKANGIMQNLTVIPEGNGYKALIGHRRLEAARAAGLERVPCAIVRDMPESEQVAVMLAENMQRADLSAVEQAQGIQMMLDLGDTISDVVAKTGMSETTVRRRVNLLQYDIDAVRTAFDNGATFDDYESLNKIEDPAKREQLLKDIGTSNFSWRYKSTLDDQEREKKNAPLYEWLDTWAEFIPEHVYDGKTVFVRSYTAGDKQEKPADYDPDRKYYYTKGYCPTVYAEYITPKMSPEEERHKAEERRKTEERRERFGKLEDMKNRMERSRREFWRDFKSLPGRSAANKLAAIMEISQTVTDYLAVNENYSDYDDFVDYIFMDTPEFKNEVEEKDWLKKQYENMLPEKRVIFNLLFALGVSREMQLLYTWDCEYTANARVAAEYEIMKICGYELSDEERAMLDGTHELFVKGGAPAPDYCFLHRGKDKKQGG